MSEKADGANLNLTFLDHLSNVTNRTNVLNSWLPCRRGIPTAPIALNILPHVSPEVFLRRHHQQLRLVGPIERLHDSVELR